MASDSLPVLSFPAILRNPGLTNRYAHLHGPSSTADTNQQQTRNPAKKNRSDQNEGKRWIRRKDNARFVGNPHIVAATKRDYSVFPAQTNSTFPEPLPPYLPRTVKLPTTPTLPVADPASANAGRFSLSLRGMRRDLRRAGGRAEGLVRDVESEMLQWLTLGGTVIAPDISSQGGHNAIQAEGTPVGNTGTVIEISRTPLQLVWKIADDAFARYVVHCCARYHEIVSFSKGTSEHRLTYLLRPNVTRPDRRAPAALDTPPVTDLDYSSNPETDDNLDSDFISEHELESDMELDHVSHTHSTTNGFPAPESPTLARIQEDTWSLVEEGGETDADEFESGSEFDSGLGASIDALQPRLEALSLSSPLPEQPLALEEAASAQVDGDPDRTLTEIQSHPLQSAASPRRRERMSARSPSSLSRSPARTRPPRRRVRASKRSIVGLQSGRSFYEYLFL
ncbi:hypothetical protein B0H34DRAFT_795549 [Crassisporium funariophilum]|nr:hypothetical protein B0H34DRAFT_795549 [Crassisporium funariophilum]